MIRVKVGPLPLILGKPEVVRAVFERAKRAAIRDVAETARADVVDRISKNLPFPVVNTGVGRRDVGITYTETGAEVGQGVTTAGYMTVQELGRRPGAAGPPLPRGGGGRAGFGAAAADARLFEQATDPIGWWVRRKFRLGGNLTIAGPGRGRKANPAQRRAAFARSLRFLVWRKIHRRGFGGKRFYATARFRTENRAPGVVNRYFDLALRRLGGKSEGGPA